jgi:DNA polymerase I-like protein with 3'-5' exonuclease and polymerase domains
MNQPTVNNYLITDMSFFERLKSYADKVDSEIISFDLETDSVNEKLAQVMGIGIAFTTTTAFYIPIRTPDRQMFWSESEHRTILTWLNNLFDSKQIIGHNLIYDVLVYECNFGKKLDDRILADTILMRHTLNEEGPFGLKETAVEELGVWADRAQDTLKNEVLAKGGSWTKDQKDMYLASTQTLGDYCCWDVLLSFMLYELFSLKLTKEGLDNLFYNEEIMPLYKEVTINMKRNGFPIDTAYYENLKSQISGEIKQVEDDIMKSIKTEINGFETELLNDEFPIKNAGNFPKALAEVLGIPLPVNKEGKTTLAKKAVDKQKEATPVFATFYDWVSGAEKDITKAIPSAAAKILFTKAAGNSANNPIRAAQEKLFFEKYEDKRHIFNLKSNDHLIELICKTWGYVTPEKTETGKPQIDDEFLESLKSRLVIEKLLDFKKLNKLLSTYVEGILERQIDGVIYTSMLQFGTTSGRFSSRNPNLQNQPRIKDEDSGLSPLVLKYVNAIRKGFVAPKGYKVVNADYASLEPVCFAHVSGDEKLKDVFRNGEDLYSRVAIETFNLTGVSAKKSDANYLKNIMPEKRQVAKVIALAIPYGAEASRISDELGISFKEANDVIDNYLNGFPYLRKYMNRCNYTAKTTGQVSTEFGRIRHLREARSIYSLYGDSILEYKWAKKQGVEDIRRKFKNVLNNSKNFPIQGLAAHIVNRAMIALSRLFKQHNIDGWIGLQVHDEITAIVKEEHSALAAKLMKECMENTTKISIPLVAEPIIADNWGEAK